MENDGFIVIEGIHKNPNNIDTIDEKTKKIHGPFKKKQAEIFAKSQIERLFKFLGIDPSEALKDYEEFISPPEIISEEEPSIDTKFNFRNLLNNLTVPSVSNSYLKYGGILLISFIFNSPSLP